jgi:hypothetical protein
MSGGVVRDEKKIMMMMTDFFCDMMLQRVHIIILNLMDISIQVLLLIFILRDVFADTPVPTSLVNSEVSTVMLERGGHVISPSC